MKSNIDLTAYFKRIGFDGKAQSDLETLKRLNFLHVRTFPFENLNPLLGLPVKIDPASLQEKMIHQKRGGFCFEENLLFLWGLQAIGFDAKPLAGRVLKNKPEEAITQQTHMLVMVKIGPTTYLTDVGFGGQSLTGPIEFITDKSQETPHEPYRILERDDHFLMQTFIKKKWETIYRFTLVPRYFVDRKVASWYASTHPDSHFTTGLSVARAGKGCRYVLSNNLFKIHHLHGQTDRQRLSSVEALKNVLTDRFNINLPKTDNLDRVLTRLIDTD